MDNKDTLGKVSSCEPTSSCQQSELQHPVKVLVKEEDLSEEITDGNFAVSDKQEGNVLCRPSRFMGIMKTERVQRSRERFSLKNFKFVDVQTIINSSSIATSVRTKMSSPDKVSSSSPFQENETTHAAEITCVSDLCEVTLKNPKVLRSSEKHQQKPCDESGTSFPGPSDLRKWKIKKNFVSACVSDIHKRRHSVKTPYVCKECGASFPTLSNLKLHKTTHLEKLYPCKICNKIFGNAAKLNIHKRSHSGEKPYVCDICDATFPYPQGLRVHRFIHVGKPYVCDLCGRTFVSNSKLRVHLRTHTGEKPFVCSVCSARFGRKDNLSTHILIHSGGKRCECELCGRTFATNESLRCHKRSHCKASVG